MKNVPNWAIQAAWWVSGIFATGSFWYFLSLKSYGPSALSAFGAIAFASIAIVLHRKQDKQLSAVQGQDPSNEFARRYTDQPSHIRFLEALPKLKAVVYENARGGWDTGVTAEMRQASYDVIDFLEYAWLRVAEFYPPKNFGSDSPEKFIRKYIQDRFSFHWGKHEPGGPGTGGTIVGIMTGGDVMEDMEKMIETTVQSLFSMSDDFDYAAWVAAWRDKKTE